MFFKSNESNQDIFTLLNRREVKESTQKTRIKKNEKKKITIKPNQYVHGINHSVKLPSNYYLIHTPEQFEEFITKYKVYKTLHSQAYTFIDTKSTGFNPFKDSIISITIGFIDNSFFYIPIKPFKHGLSQHISTLSLEYTMKKLSPLLEKDTLLILSNSKQHIHALYNWCDFDITYNIFWDTEIAASLLNENHPKGVKEWYKEYVLPRLISNGTILNTIDRKKYMIEKTLYDQLQHHVATYFACYDIFMLKSVFEYQKRIFENPKFNLVPIYKLFREIEMPLIAVLTTAERKGIKISEEFLSNDVKQILQTKLQSVKKEILNYLGSTITLNNCIHPPKQQNKYNGVNKLTSTLFNINSPAHLAQKLYIDNAILKPIMEYDKGCKSVISKLKTDRKTLIHNLSKHPVIPLILEYRRLVKLISSFCDSLPKEQQGTIDNKIHPIYNSVGTKTGRMSCSSPNLKLWAA
ncbi:DNA polymerase [Bacillus cereus]|uniref:DNA polymerase n=1 Tax=Bacillus cereus TaxID=1396 RepID=UPI00062DB86C|nr:DNA polymerase [Bacillus cereus]KLA33074.1 DNA polymerase I [Bacillus cereus]MCY8957343.1 DNA polymerase [Bacillus cereus]